MTDEEIAREMIQPENDDGSKSTIEGRELIAWIDLARGENKDACSTERLRLAILPLLQRAREEGAREATAHNLPGPVLSEEEIKSMEGYFKGIEIILTYAGDARKGLMLISHIRWLEQCLRDAGNDDWGHAFRAGYKRGKEDADRQHAGHAAGPLDDAEQDVELARQAARKLG